MNQGINRPGAETPPVVFVVDDEADTCEILSAVFEASGYEVAVFDSGESVLEALGPKPDVGLLVLDMMMPGIDGLEVCRRIRENIPSEELPIIVATAFDDGAMRLKALEQGADDYITKPFEPREVVKRAEIQLKIRRVLEETEWQRRSYEALFETIPIGVVQLSAQSDPPLVNPIARDILSLNETDCNVNQIAHQLGFDPLVRCRGDEDLMTEDRTYRGGWYRVDCRRIGSSTNLLGALVVLRDVTRELELDNLKTEFAQVVSHELRTPLTAINNAVNLLGDTKHLGEDIHDKLFGIINRNTKRMLSMIRDLLDLSRLQAGRTELTLIEGNLRRITENVSDALGELARSRNVSVSIKFDDSVPALVFMDVAAVERVVTNLLSNAIKYTREGTAVGIHASRQDRVQGDQHDARADLLNTFARGYIGLAITDQGMGIPAEEQERIFDKFVRINRKVHADASGTGLGLSIAQKLIRAHGGELWVESVPGQGASFIFQIPLFERYGALAVSIADRLRDAKRNRRSVGIVVLQLSDNRSGGGHPGIDWNCVGDLAVVARNALLRSSDFAVFNPHLGEVVLILEGCMPEILPQVAVRVSEVLREHLTNTCKDTPIRITHGHAFSGADSSLEQAVALLSKTRSKANSQQAIKRRILVVDDDEMFLQSTAKILSIFDFDPMCASSADKALKLIEQQPPDLVILDILMPEFDGYRLCLEIRSRPELKHIPIFFISGIIEDDARTRVFSAGGNEFLRKPIEAKELIKTMRLYIG